MPFLRRLPELPRFRRASGFLVLGLALGTSIPRSVLAQTDTSKPEPTPKGAPPAVPGAPTSPGTTAPPASSTPPAPAGPRLTRAPKLVQFVEAPHPEAEKGSAHDVTVVLQIAISELGAVTEAVVVGSGGLNFDAAALDAVKQFRFEPAEIDDQPAPVKITYRYQFTSVVETPVTASFRGVVRDKATKAPLSGVTVTLVGVGSVVTDASGVFTFDTVEPGTHPVSLTRADLPTIGTDESFEAGKELSAEYDVELPPPAPAEGTEEETDDYEVVILAPRITKQVVSTEVRAEEARSVAGTQGDVLKIVENLPGVARASAGSGQVVVWGAAPQDTRTYVGVVRIPQLYHFGGLRSVVHTDRVASVELVPGGYGASHGRGLGGLVRVGLNHPATDRFHVSLQADLLDASAFVSAPIGTSWSAAAAVRRSHVADLASAVTDQSVQEYFTLPQYFDASARVRYAIDHKASLELGGLFSDDVQRRRTPSNDPARRISDTRALTFGRVDVAYHTTLDDGAELDIAPWYGHDHSERIGEFGGTPTSTTTDADLVGARLEWRGRLHERATAKLGVDAEAVFTHVTRGGSITSPPREGDVYVFGRTPADQVNYDDWSVITASAAPYAELDSTWFDGHWHVTPGVRVEPYVISVNRRLPADPNRPDAGVQSADLAIQPRLATRVSVVDGLGFKAAAGLYAQPPLADDLSSVFGNPKLGVSKGSHFLVGGTLEPFPELSFEATAFVTFSERLAVRSPLPAPGIAEALVQDGHGRSIGGQFLLRKNKADGKFFGWVAYTILESQRQDRLDGSWRAFDYDQTHVLTALGSYEIGWGIEVGARARVASGFPRTPVVGSFYDARTNRYEPLLGPYNSDRIPTFVQVDARIAKELELGSIDLEIYLDVQNVLNEGNAEEIAYSPDYGERRYITGLPILPVLGAKGSY